MVSTQKNGYLAEEKFIQECLVRDIPISKPVFNTEPYDFICEIEDKFLSVQVKKSWMDEKGRKQICLKNSYPRSDIKHYVSERPNVDFIAAYDDEYDDWYIIPRDVYKNIKSVLCIRRGGKYGKFINNFSFTVS